MSDKKAGNSNKNEKKPDSVTAAKRMAQKEEKEEEPFTEEEIKLMKAYSLGPCDDSIKDSKKAVKKQGGAN